MRLWLPYSVLFTLAKGCPDQTFSSAGGVIAGSVSNTGGYANDEACTYTFDYLQGGVAFTFSTFNTENGYDDVVFFTSGRWLTRRTPCSG